MPPPRRFVRAIAVAPFVLAHTVILLSWSDAAAQERLVIEARAVATDALLQAVSPVDDLVIWMSGHDATYAVTDDGGERWRVRTVPEAGVLQFRDVAAFDSRRAYLMSSGAGEQSRIYRTDDGGERWTLQYTAGHPDAFLDCMDFWTPEVGLAYGDAVDGTPFILRTEDGGGHWNRVRAETLPRALEGEGGFAASGTCLIAGHEGRAWIATGNADRARVLRTEDFGATWSVADGPVVAGGASGLATIAMADDGAGIALGGAIGNDSIRTQNVAVTEDFGATWSVGGDLTMPGPVYGAALAPGRPGLVVAVGPRGVDWSADGGLSWQPGDTRTHWAVAFTPDGTGWAVGPQGRVHRLRFEPR